jgi:linoleoyl-CoA desaturase
MATSAVRNKEVRFIDTNKDKTQFFATLRKRVDGYFKENNISKHYNRTMVIKTIVLLAFYILPFTAFTVFNPSIGIVLLLWTIMGFSKAGIGMSVMHDANHGAYSSSSRVNYWLGHTLNLVGGSVPNWKLQHNILHHTYTNVVNMDDDVDDKAFMRFTPHTKLKWFHKLQFIYAFFFYGVLTLYWAVAKDFIQHARYTRNGVNKNTRKQNQTRVLKIILSKLMYFFVFFFVPVYFAGVPFLHVLIGFLLMHFIAGVMLTVIFQLAHAVEGTSYPIPDENGTIENNWAVHQLNTTVNFARHNKIVSWYVGGLNFQVEHHLFPTICHVHYPKIAEIVKSTATEYNVPYMENTTIMGALKSHIKALQNLGGLPNINEALA